MSVVTADLREEDYVHELPAPVRAELARLLDAIARGEDVEADVHAAVADATARTFAALSTGCGLILLRGVPVDGRARDHLAALYTMMGRALGRPMRQNSEGETITDVRDTGDDPSDPEVRVYRTRIEQDFHTDGADAIGLLCLQTARAGGVSRIVSSVRVYEAVCAARPDLAPLLLEPWHFHVPGQAARGLPDIITRPIVTVTGDRVQTFYLGWWIRNAQGRPGVPPLTEAQRELLAVYEATASDPALYLEMTFRPGDLQWIRNAAVLHKRTAYEDHPEAARKRHLLRLWLRVEAFGDELPSYSRKRS